MEGFFSVYFSVKFYWKYKWRKKNLMIANKKINKYKRKGKFIFGMEENNKRRKWFSCSIYFLAALLFGFVPHMVL